MFFLKCLIERFSKIMFFFVSKFFLAQRRLKTLALMVDTSTFSDYIKPIQPLANGVVTKGKES